MASTIVRGDCFRCGREKNLRWNHSLERGECRQRGVGIGTDEERSALRLQDRRDDGVAARPRAAVRGFAETA